MRKLGKFETVAVRDVKITIDVSQLLKADVIYFNATEMAKPFGKIPNEYLRSTATQRYIKALEVDSGISRNELVKTKRGGKYQGTWLHRKLGLDFARWLSPEFAVALDRFTEQKLMEAARWRQERSEARTGFLPMTDAIQRAHDPVKFYHYSNEADLINRIVFGMSAKQIRDKYGDDVTPRDIASEAELAEIKRLQIINTGLIEIGMDYEERKKHLQECFNRTPFAVE